MVMPFHEPMKQRFKKKDRYGRWDECVFKNTMDYMDTWFINIGNKPHSHAWGRKPSWRAKRKTQRRQKCLRFFIAKNRKGEI